MSAEIQVYNKIILCLKYIIIYLNPKNECKISEWKWLEQKG